MKNVNENLKKNKKNSKKLVKKVKMGWGNIMKILGMMSGTSGDGIDGALVDFLEDGSCKLLWHKSFDFTKAQFERIQMLMKPCSSIDITLGNSYIAELYAKAYDFFVESIEDKPDYLAVHGQTVWHQPKPVVWDDINLTGSLQIIDAPRLAIKTGVPVINNFRTADMAVGGQGAPLVPFADLKLFGNLFPEDCIVLNCGGMANITAIRKVNNKAEVFCAFDTGPANVLMDAYMQTNNIGNYDKDGLLAASGSTIKEILDDIMQDPYFKAPYPKSTGREYFNQSILGRFNSGYSNADVMSTLLDVTVLSIAEAIKMLDGKLRFPLRLIAAGGGALNKELIRRLKTELMGYCSVCTSEDFGVPIMAREAMAFAILGYAFIVGEPSNVPTATGAKCPVILGQLSKPAKKQN